MVVTGVTLKAMEETANVSITALRADATLPSWQETSSHAR